MEVLQSEVSLSHQSAVFLINQTLLGFGGGGAAFCSLICGSVCNLVAQGRDGSLQMEYLSGLDLHYTFFSKLIISCSRLSSWKLDFNKLLGHASCIVQVYLPPS